MWRKHHNMDLNLGIVLLCSRIVLTGFVYGIPTCIKLIQMQLHSCMCITSDTVHATWLCWLPFLSSSVFSRVQRCERWMLETWKVSNTLKMTEDISIHVDWPFRMCCCLQSFSSMHCILWTNMFCKMTLVSMSTVPSGGIPASQFLWSVRPNNRSDFVLCLII